MFPISAYLRYYFRARTRFRLHSPLLYSLATDVLDDRRNFYAFSDLKTIRSILLHDSSLFDRTDYGAGSVSSGRKTRVRDFVRNTAGSRTKGELLFRLTHWYQPEMILETGTGIGLSAMYMHRARQSARLITIEGDPYLAATATNIHRQCHADRIEVRCGTFDQVLPEVLTGLSYPLQVYLDGHHEYTAMKRYLHMLAETLTGPSMLIIDDIRWSAGMFRFWEETKSQDWFDLRVDLGSIGLLIRDPGTRTRQDYALIPYRRKPYMI